MVRLKRLSAALQSASSDADAMLITHPVDVRYLTGFTGSNAAVVLPLRNPRRGKTRHLNRNKPVLFTDGRYIQQAKQETKHAGVVIAQGPILREACTAMVAAGVRR